MRTIKNAPARAADERAGDTRSRRRQALGRRQQMRVNLLGTSLGAAVAGCSAVAEAVECSRPPVRPRSLRFRSFRLIRPVAILVLAACTAAVAHAYAPAHAHAGPGYLGVSLVDLDADTVARLHLKDTHGALIASIDRDAPAAAAGLRARDVILEASGHKVDSVEALRRRLRETTAGTTLLLRISRDGAEQSISVRLGDQSEIEERAWNEHFNTPEALPAAADPGGDTAGASHGGDPSAATAFAAPSGSPGHVSSFLGRFSMSALYTGADFDPLSTQLADYFGVHDGAGLLVRTVNENSPAWQAGLRAGDVVLRVNNQPVVSREDWTKQIRANRGRPVQLAVMRNRREQTMAMSAGWR